MLITGILELRRYKNLGQRMEQAIGYLEQMDSDHLDDGRVELDGTMLYGTVSRYETIDPVEEESAFETHRNYVDIHCVLEGEETIYWSRSRSMTPTEDGYDPAEDLLFYREKPLTHPVVLRADDVAVFFPEDAHMPRCRVITQSSPVRKLVLKVRL